MLFIMLTLNLTLFFRHLDFEENEYASSECSVNEPHTCHYKTDDERDHLNSAAIRIRRGVQ